MKKTKILSLIFVFMVLVSVFANSVQAASTYTNNTISTSTNFQITDSGVVRVGLCYCGREGITTQAKITITISKRSYLFFWNKLETAIYYSDDIYYIHVHESKVYSSGTYKCEVEYCISGTGGADDILTFEDTATY